jgi:hypothetical protein
VGIRWYALVIDCKDIAAQARWWAEALGWEITYEDADEVDLRPPGEPDMVRGLGRVPDLVFLHVPEGKQVKNRLHIDLAPWAADDHAAEVRRLEDLGATRVDVGQGPDAKWVVLADPEGNEFCVLGPRD